MKKIVTLLLITSIISTAVFGQEYRKQFIKGNISEKNDMNFIQKEEESEKNILSAISKLIKNKKYYYKSLREELKQSPLTTNCYDITNLLLQKSIDSNEILYFVDDSGDLNVMMILYLAFAQNGDRNHYLIKVTK